MASKELKMKKYLKVGIGSLIPLVLVIQVVVWLANFSKNTLENVLNIELAWWGVLAGVASTLIAILLLGVIITHIKFVKRWKNRIETKVIEKVPGVKTVYKFGKDVVDTFITDIKEDGDFTVVEVDMGGFKTLGVLTDAKNDLGFIISAPSPLTGVVMKLPNYRKLDMTFMDAVQINTSLGRINGDKWK